MTDTGWFLCICFVFMGWQLLPEPTWVYYISSAVLLCMLMTREALLTRRRARKAVFLFGAFNAATTAGCGALFAAHADGRHFLCDRGSGLPVSLVSGVLGIALAVRLLKGSGDG